jgi:SPX domain protein involved in polyphosphate accumulation
MQAQFHFQRFEFKYLLNESQALDLLEECLKAYFVWDPRSGGRGLERGYFVNSLYFDSPAMKCYQDKKAGLKKRFKMRVRRYEGAVEGDGRLFLELKKKYDALVMKDRVPMSSVDSARIVLGEFDIWELKRSIPEKFSTTLDTLLNLTSRFSLAPNIFIRYRRRPLESSFIDRLRITFDSDLEAGVIIDGRVYWYTVMPGAIVMELKFNNVLPRWLHGLFAKRDFERVSFSKYCAGVERLQALSIL